MTKNAENLQICKFKLVKTK